MESKYDKNECFYEAETDSMTERENRENPFVVVKGAG